MNPKRRLVDTNLIVRHLTQDHPAHARIAGKLFAACDSGELTLIILPAVLAECVFVLESFYGHSPDRIAESLDLLISGAGIEIADAPIHRNALDRYRKGNLHFVDCVLAAKAATEKIELATFDSGLARLPDVKVNID
jgi:predicted nucleic-acid-binding protein